jgi:hypothetical protein
MMQWETGDRVVDCILQKMDGLSEWPEDADPEQTHQLISALIEIQGMLPTAVARHFKLPHLFVGDAHFRNGTGYRKRLVSSIVAALRTGLESVNGDALLKRGGGADYCDRPSSRGEEILDAAKAFEEDGTASSLSHLKATVSSTRLQSRVKTIEMLCRARGHMEIKSPDLRC